MIPTFSGLGCDKLFRAYSEQAGGIVARVSSSGLTGHFLAMEQMAGVKFY
jgi:hypothetical protein